MPHQLPPVDDDVFEALQGLAEPLVDDVNTVLRRLLGLHGSNGDRPRLGDSHSVGGAAAANAAPANVQRAAQPRGRRSKASKTKKQGASRARAPRGTLLPEREYEIPLLRALDARGGAAPASEVIEDVGSALEGRLTDTDQEILDSGLTRWRNRVQFVRLKLVQAGQMKKDSPRGTWEITAAGRQRLSSGGGNE